MKRPPELTADTLFEGRLHLDQDRRGYRFSIDAVLLASFCRLGSCRRVADFGAGCGVIPLILATRHPRLRLTAVEIQPALAALARSNIERNAFQARIAVLEADLRALKPADFGGPLDAIVCNPPYRRQASGRINPQEQRALARHEIALTLPELVAAVRRVLKNGGRFLTIYPAERAAELLSLLRAERIEPKRLRMVHSKRAAGAKLVLVEGILGAHSGLSVAAPLFLYTDDGVYTGEVRDMLRP